MAVSLVELALKVFGMLLFQVITDHDGRDAFTMEEGGDILVHFALLFHVVCASPAVVRGVYLRRL